MASGHERKGPRLYTASCALYAELQSSALDEVAFWVQFRQRYVPPARDRLGAAAAEKVKNEGRSLDWEQALAYALELLR